MYQITIIQGIEEFDFSDSGQVSMLNYQLIPILWASMVFLSPVLVVITPPVLAIFYYKPELFLTNCYVYSDLTPDNYWGLKEISAPSDKNRPIKMIKIAREGIASFIASI